MMTRPSSSPGGVSSRAAPAWGRGAEPTRWPSLASAGIASIEIATALTRVAVAQDGHRCSACKLYVGSVVLHRRLGRHRPGLRLPHLAAEGRVTGPPR